MISIGNGWLRRSLLICLYALGVFGILASGDGSDGFRFFSCNLSVRGIAPVTDGTVWAGVFSRTDAGVTADRVVLLNSDGSEQRSYPIIDGGNENSVRVIALAGGVSTDLYVGGDFDKGILRLNADGSLDMGFAVGSGFNGRVTSITPAADGSGNIYVGGFFTLYKNSVVSGLVRLDSNGLRDNGFIAAVDNVQTVAMAVEAPFLSDVYSGGQNLPRLERWDDNGMEDPAFTSAIGPVLSVIPSADSIMSGDVYVGGSFTNRIIRLEDTGTEDAGFAVGTGFDDDVLSIVRANDMTDDIYVGGSFTTYKGSAANGILRLNDNGTPDANFIYGSGFSDPGNIFPFVKVASVARATDGTTDVYVGGGFSEYDGNASNGIVRLNDDGSLDAGFDVRISVDGETCSNQTILK